MPSSHPLPCVCYNVLYKTLHAWAENAMKSVHNLHCTIRILQYTLLFMNYALRTLHTEHYAHWILFSVHCTVYTLYSAYCTRCKLYTVHAAFCTLCTLHTVHAVFSTLCCLCTLSTVGTTQKHHQRFPWLESASVSPSRQFVPRRVQRAGLWHIMLALW